MVKKILILTGPQGSGNHLFSKCFALSDQIGGWGELNNEYWLGHHTEPFNEVWQGKKRLMQLDLATHNYYVTSVSIPFVKNGQNVVPDLIGFINDAKRLGFEVEVGLINRDKNILELQQQRVRGEVTLNTFLKYTSTLNVKQHYLSHESLILNKSKYIDYICRLIDFPKIDSDEVNKLLDTSNSNQKYIKDIESYWLDDEVKKAINDSIEV